MNPSAVSALTQEETQEELFEEISEPQVPENSIQAQKQMERIFTLREIQAQFDRQKDEAVAYYEAEKARVEKSIQFLTMSLGAFLEQSGLKELRTPKGKASFRNLTRITWPEDEALVSWAKQLGKADLVRVKEYPAKKSIKEYITATGDAPEGFEAVKERKLYVSNGKPEAVREDGSL